MENIFLMIHFLSKKPCDETDKNYMLFILYVIIYIILDLNYSELGTMKNTDLLNLMRYTDKTYVNELINLYFCISKGELDTNSCIGILYRIIENIGNV